MRKALRSQTPEKFSLLTPLSEGNPLKEHLGGVAGMVSEQSEEQRRREMNKIFLAGENYCVSL